MLCARHCARYFTWLRFKTTLQVRKCYLHFTGEKLMLSKMKFFTWCHTDIEQCGWDLIRVLSDFRTYLVILEIWPTVCLLAQNLPRGWRIPWTGILVPLSLVSSSEESLAFSLALFCGLAVGNHCFVFCCWLWAFYVFGHKSYSLEHFQQLVDSMLSFLLNSHFLQCPLPVIGI